MNATYPAPTRAARVRKPSVWGLPFDAPDALPATPAVSTWNQAGAILDAAVASAVKTPAVVVLALGVASHTFKPNGKTVTIISRGVENWGTRILSTADARLHYRKLRRAGFLVW